MKLKHLYLLLPGTVIKGSRRSMKHLWSYLPAGLCIGLSFALLLFFYWRGRVLEAWPV